MTLRRRKSIAWIALAAMLFGAVSPALAGALFQGRSDVLGRMLGLPAVAAGPAPHAAAAEDDGCPHEAEAGAAGDGHEPSHAAHHDSSGGTTHDDKEHAAHGIFCSFCLAASSVVTVVPAGAAPLPAKPVEALAVSSGRERKPVSPQLSSHRSRAPPALS